MSTNINAEFDSVLFHTNASTFLELYDIIPNLFFYVKDVRQHFLWMNTMLRELLGETEPTGFYNKTDADYFTPDLVFLYQREDNEVIASGRAIINQPWFVPACNEKQRWFISSKFPLRDRGGDIVAIAGIMRNLDHEYKSVNPLGEMKAVLDYIFTHYSERITLEDLAQLVFLSPRQFERYFQKLFKVSPSNFILKFRTDIAMKRLIESEDSITQIAIACGFYDNSYLTRQLKKMTGMTPIKFRTEYGKKE
ncbi:MAG: AraC family transcriptional regulator [Planctomycetaceae bacterium]|jgi:AraC-like DNA-binding protein|nr:AraC family transcriptional regulator [Planctomycetaceae bacterium]